MTYQLSPSNYFAKKLKKLVNRNKLLQVHIQKTLDNLIVNPQSPSLKSHKVNTELFGECYSSFVTGDIRLIWQYDKNDDIIKILLLIDIGGHDEVY